MEELAEGPVFGDFMVTAIYRGKYTNSKEKLYEY